MLTLEIFNYFITPETHCLHEQFVCAQDPFAFHLCVDLNRLKLHTEIQPVAYLFCVKHDSEQKLTIKMVRRERYRHYICNITPSLQFQCPYL